MDRFYIYREERTANEPWRVSWPILLSEKYSANLSAKVGGEFVFKNEDPNEERFLHDAKSLGLVVVQYKYISPNRNELSSFPFYYFSVKIRRGIELNSVFDYSHSCTSNSPILCRSGVKQIKSISYCDVAEKRPVIFQAEGPPQPYSIYIINREMVELLLRHAATGFKLAPCRRNNNDDHEFRFTTDPMSESAEWFQLLIQHNTKVPPIADGKGVLKCPQCDTYLGAGARLPAFNSAEDFRNLDFQYYDQCVSSDFRTIKMITRTNIISTRMLDLFLKNNSEGWTSFLQKPKVSFGVVNIKGILPCA